MYKILFSKAVLILIFSVFSITFCLGTTQRNIQIDQSSKLLIAPEACNYKWYRDGRLLNGETGQSISVKEGGNYQVESVDELGEVWETKITIAINAEGAIIKIILIGDSTVANAPANLYPNMGWGQVFQYYFNSANIQVMNFAKSGTSTTTFYSGYWPAAKKAIAAGDYVFMQFGHNDQKENLPIQYAAPYGKYQEYLTKYINEVRALGAIPVLVTSVNRNLWNGNQFDSGSLGDYPDAVRKLGVTLKVPVVDLNAKSATLFSSLGQNYLSNYVFNNYQAGEYPNYPNGNSDKTHFNEMGAIEVSRLVIECIKELSANASMRALASYLNPVNEVKVTANPKAAASMITRTASYPKGMNITLKTTPKAPNKFYNWNNIDNKSVSNKLIYSFKMEDKETSYTAIYQGAVTTCSAIVSTSGPVSICEGGSVILTASSGSSYIWKNGNTQVGTAQTFVAKSTGTYTVEVTDGNGCKAISANTVITIQPNITWYADTDGDGKGDASQSLLSCTQPSGYVADNSDLCPGDKNKAEPGNCGCDKPETSCFDCANVLNGSATIDLCGICVGGNTGKKACVHKLQAEEACEADGIKNETSNVGFEGSGYVNGDNAIGKSITFSLEAPVTGNYKILFRYANGGAANRSSNIELNSVEENTMLLFPSTGAFTSWSTLETDINLNEGNNKLKLTSKTTDGLPNLDYIGFTDNTISAGPCLITSNDSKVAINNEVICYPNPFTVFVLIQAPQEFSYSIYDQSGKVVENGKGFKNGSAGSELSPGIYTLTLQTQKTTDAILLIKK